MKTLTIIMITACFVCGCATSPDTFRVSIADVPLEKGERISGVNLTISGGRVSAVHSIPLDWHLSIEGPSSGVTTLDLQAGHGVSYQTDCRQFSSFVTVQQLWSNMCVTGSVTLSNLGAEGERPLSKENIILK
jgi:hypothetical protein